MKTGEGKFLKKFFGAFFICALVFSLQNSAFADEKSANIVKSESTEMVMSIDDCVNFALEHDPNIKVYRDKNAAAKSHVGQAKSGYFPSLTGGTGYNISNTNYSGNRDGSSSNNYYQLNLGINEMIWDFGRTTAKINMQKFNYDASFYDLDYIILQTVYRVKTAYAAVLAARANEDIYERSVKINELNYERTNALYRAGLKSKIDVVNAEVYLTDAKIQLIEAQNKYQVALITLNNAMYYTNAPVYTIQNTESFNFQKNYNAKNEINVSYRKQVDDEIADGAILTSGIEKRDIIKDFTFKPFATSMDESIQKAYENRPDLKSLKLVKNAAEESLKAIKKSYLPSLNANAGYNYQKSSSLGSSGLSIAANLSLPNVNAMDVKYKIDEGKSYLDIAINNIDLSQKNIYFEVQNYYVNMKQLEKRIPLMGRKVAQTLENFELADGRYTVGLGNYIELQQAQTNYNNAQQAFVQSVFEYNVARFRLEQAMGVNEFNLERKISQESVKPKKGKK